jgi:EAL and modified HD-GYP domain-containing signal transduction protein
MSSNSDLRRIRLRYLARQVILNRSQQSVAYELLYRGGRESSAIISAGEDASQETLDSSLIMGLDVICGNRIAYFNCTRELLLSENLRLLPPHRVMLEILEYVAPDQEVLQACRELKELGFRIALDDFVPTAASRKFLPYADVLKVDVRSTTAQQRQQIVNEFCGRFILLAEKVETEEEFEAARIAGFDLFQGYYFGLPELFCAEHVSAERLQGLRMAEAMRQSLSVSLPLSLSAQMELAVK